MDKNLTFRYDAIGDILHVDKTTPYAEQESDEISELVVGRWNPDTGELENLEIISFIKRLKLGDLSIPLDVDMKLAIEADV